jgi:hypothetical protein
MISTNLYIHIGLHKTGSTLLQRCFYNNYDKLINESFLFPRTGFLDLEKKGGSNFTTAGHDLFVKAALSRNKRFRSTLLDSLYEEIQKTKSHTVLISAENFTNHQTGDLSRQAKALFHDYSNIRIILTLRNIYDWINSYYKDRVTSGWEFEKNDIYSFIKKNKTVIYPTKHIESWSRSFGKKNIDVVILGKSLKETGLLKFYTDFFGVGSVIHDCENIFINKGASNSFTKAALQFNRRVFPSLAARQSVAKAKNELSFQDNSSSLLTKESVCLIDQYIHINYDYTKHIIPVIGDFAEIYTRHHIRENNNYSNNSAYSIILDNYRKKNRSDKNLVFGIFFYLYSYLPLRFRIMIKRIFMKYK